jgi:hypothetical protein
MSGTLQFVKPATIAGTIHGHNYIFVIALAKKVQMMLMRATSGLS